MGAIVFFAIVAAAVAVDRFQAVVWRASINATGFMAQVQKLVLADRIEEAIELCEGESAKALPRVLVAGLARADGPDVEIQNAVDERVLEVFPDLQRRTAYLPMLANVATLTGLLGTIHGLIRAFDHVAHAPPDTKQTLLAQGIAVAMYPTFAGLVVAIPTLVVYSVVQGHTVRIMDDVDQYALKTVNLLIGRRRAALGALAGRPGSRGGSGE
jgi:biopolymer transport protein ExbB